MYDPRIEAECVRILYARSVPVYLGSLVAVTLLTAMLWGHASISSLLLWASWMVVLTVVRYALVLQFRRQSPLGQAQQRWKHLALSGIALNGASWGMASLMFFIPDSPPHQSMLLIILVAVTAGGVVTLAAVRVAAVMFLLLIAVPIVGRLLCAGGELHTATAAATVMFNVFMLRFAKMTGDTITTQLRLRFENSDLALHLGASKTKTEALNAELVKAHTEALQLAQVKSQFMATMSHEIRTPMNGVLGMLELLLNTPLQSKQRRLAETAYRSGTALLDVINDILDFSKIEAGKLILNHVGYNLREVIEDVVEALADRAHRKGVELLYSLPDVVPVALKGDPVRLRQVLINLLGNAIKFTDHGEVVVTVAPIEIEADAVLLRFSVRDTGIGIAPEHQASIFEGFSQGDTSVIRKYGGTGLGLAIAKELVELMAGTIGVDSIPGKGSTFWFTARFAQQSALPSTALTPPSALQGIRVLIVDDNDTCRCILEEQLRAWGMETQSAAHGVEALDMVRAQAKRGESYDLVIVDQEMPKMDSITFVRALQAEQAPVNRRILLLTAGWQEDIQGWRRLGIAAYVPKPVRQARLYNALMTVLGSTESRQPTRAISLPNAMEHNTTFQAYILLAEDNRVNQEVATGMLESLGCTVEVADNGLQVLEAVSSTTYDLIFMDCEMPEMDGFEAAKALRAREATTAGAPLRIIALTAHALVQHQQACLAAGMDDFLSKPFTRGQLQAVLARWLPASPPSPTRNKATSPGESAIAVSPETSIDPAALEAIRAMQRPGRPDVLQRVIQSYLGYTPELLDALRQAVAHDDAAAMEQAAHSMKSSSAQVGARHLAQLCKEMEAKGQARDTANAADVLASIDAEFVGVQRALSKHLDAGVVSTP